MTRIPDAEIEDLKSRNPVHAVAADSGVRLTARARAWKGWTHRGPCPLCSAKQKRSDQRFDCNAEAWACAACGQGGDVIRLIQLRDGVDFKTAVERLGGVRQVSDTPATAARAGREGFMAGRPRTPDGRFDSDALQRAYEVAWDKAKRAADYEAFARERERHRLFENFWQRAVDWKGTAVAEYLARRGLAVPPGAKLRFLDDCPYFLTGDEIEPKVVHRGPAMLAAILNAQGRFAGLHFTWLDASLVRDASRTVLDDASRAAAARRWKAEIVDPLSGELLKAKKSRGSKQGGYIDLGGVPHPPLPPQGDLARDFPADRVFDRQYSGEGIESTLAVYTAMVQARREVVGIAWRAGIDLGNLCGAASDSARHPTLKDKAGRPRRVPGPAPDLESPSMPVIAGCRDYVQLADGDSDAFTTAQAMARGEVRRRAQGVPVRTLWPPAGLDFNDWLLSTPAMTTAKDSAA